MKGHHQDRRDNNTNTKPLEGLTEETIADEAPNKQVSRQWNECLKENWWKDTKITIMGEHMWKIITEPWYRLSAAKHNMLKVIKTPKEDHRRAVIWKHPEKYLKEEINWNNAQYSQLIWQLVALRTNEQTLLTVILKDPTRGHNSIVTDHNHIKAVALLPYEAIIKALEIATFPGKWMLCPSNCRQRHLSCPVTTQRTMQTTNEWTNDAFQAPMD